MVVGGGVVVGAVVVTVVVVAETGAQSVHIPQLQTMIASHVPQSQITPLPITLALLAAGNAPWTQIFPLFVILDSATTVSVLPCGIISRLPLLIITSASTEVCNVPLILPPLILATLPLSTHIAVAVTAVPLETVALE